MYQLVRKDATVQGMVCVVVAMLVNSLQDLIMKWISGAYPLYEIMLVRSIVATVVTLAILRFDGGLGALRTRRPGLHLIRGLLLTVANTAYFTSLAALPLAETTAIFFVAPLIITALSVPFLGEKVGMRRWFAVLAGLAGVIVMLRPGSSAFEPAALLPALAALCYALMQMITRRLGATDRASTMAFYIHIMFIANGLIAWIGFGDGRFATGAHPSAEFLLRAWAWPNAEDAMLMLACGVIVGLAAFLLSQAYRIAEATLVAPFEYVALPLSVMWGMLIWGDRPDLTAVGGIALIVGSGLFVYWRETARGRPVAASTPMPPQG